MNLPSFGDHCRRVGVDPLDRRPYISRYLDAKNLGSDRHEELAHLAFNLVQAQFRLVDISQTVALDNAQRVAAQRSEVDGWQQKADRFLNHVPGRLFEEMLEDFSTIAAVSRVLDESERNFVALGLAGRIGEVDVAPVVEPYSWEGGPSGKRDSALAE